MAIPTYYSYDLGTVTVPAGSLEIKLHCEVSSLTIPDGIARTLRFPDFITERYVITDDGSEMQNTNAEFIEDYSEYTQGFWFKVLTAGHAELQLLLDEGAGETSFFWGRVIEFDSGFEEVSLVTSNIIRRGSFRLADAFTERLNDITALELYNELDNASYYTEISNDRLVNMKYIFSGMLKLAFAQTIDTADITQDAEALQYEANSDWRSFLDMWVFTQAFALGVWGTHPNSFNIWDADGWSALDILRMICREHCIYPRHTQANSSADHKIQFISKGASEGYSTYITEPRKPSSSILYAPKHPTSVRNIWIERGNGLANAIIIEGDLVTPSDVPDNTTFDVNLRIAFNTGGYMDYVSGGVLYNQTDYRYYANGWSSGTTTAESAVAQFMNENWGSVPATLYGYERIYQGIGLDDGTTEEHVHAHLGPDTFISINDGVASKNFVAIEVGKNLETNQLKVIWRELAT